MTIAAPGCDLFTVEVGEGPEVAVLLHGGPGASHDYLRPQLDGLAEPGVRRLFYYDQRGGGKSRLASGAEAGTWRDHVDDLESIRLHLGQEQLVLVGYSWGGLLALFYATTFRDRVAKLALIAPAPPSAAERDRFRERLAAAQKRSDVESFRASIDRNDKRARFAAAVAGYFADPRRALELTPFLVQQRAEEAVWHSLGDYDLRPALDGLSLPALIFHGADDPIPIECSRRTAEQMGARLVEIPHCGHVPYIEAPEKLLPPLRAFLAR